MDEYEVVWAGRGPLTDALDRDYAAMKGDGWDLIWVPPPVVPLHPWESLKAIGRSDPNRYIEPVVFKRTIATQYWASRRLESVLDALAAMSFASEALRNVQSSK